MIRRGAIWRIGDGQSVQVWRDNWLPGKIMARVLSPCRDEDGDAKVSMFTESENCRWKEEILDYYLISRQIRLKQFPCVKLSSKTP